MAAWNRQAIILTYPFSYLIPPLLWAKPRTVSVALSFCLDFLIGEIKMKSKSYEEFVEKFAPKKTTDDCYTPPEIYDLVKDWAINEYGWHGRPVVRPFYPGGDFENYNYPDDCVVIDNPPFSIFSKIVRFYKKHDIDFFCLHQIRQCSNQTHRVISVWGLILLIKMVQRLQHLSYAQ